MYQKAKHPKAMLTVPGGDHNAVVYKAGMEYYAQMESFLRTHVDRDTSLRIDPTKKYPVPKKASAANIAAQIPETLPETSTEYLAAAQPVKPEKNLNTAELKASECKRPVTLQFHKNDISFKLPHRVPRASSKSFRKTFKAKKPITFF